MHRFAFAPVMWLTVITLMLMALAAGAQGTPGTDQNLPPDPRPVAPTPDRPLSLIRNGDFRAPLNGSWDYGDGKTLPVEVLSADIAGFHNALRVTTSPAPDGRPWTLQVGQKVDSYVAQGETIYMRAWMRSPDRVQATFVYEQAAPPNPKMIERTVHLTPEWKEYRFAGIAPRTFLPGQSQFKFFLGYDKGIAEIAGVRVQDFGKAPASLFHETIDYWNGQVHSDAWRAAALARIERIRKGEVEIHVLDAMGKPVPNARVTIEQQQHYFRFGTAAPANRLIDAGPDSLRFQTEVKRLFNTITFENDLKWREYPRPDARRMHDVENAIDWLNTNGIHNIRGHNLLWGAKKYLPAGAADLDKDALLRACRDRVVDQVTRWRGKVYIWDVVNEATDSTWLWDTIGWENFANAYKWARQADPHVLLCYNDYHGFGGGSPNDPGLKKEDVRIQYLIDHNAPVDVLGEQAHLGPSLIPIQNILDRLDDLAKFGKAIEITEFDLGVPDDQIHANYVRDFLTAAFSHPAVQGIIQWGFWEGSQWRAREGGAMFRKDWSKRPGEEAYEDLVFDKWWTHASLTTDRQGRCVARPFYGTHHVTVEKDGKEVTQEFSVLPGNAEVWVVQLGKPSQKSALGK